MSATAAAAAVSLGARQGGALAMWLVRGVKNSEGLIHTKEEGQTAILNSHRRKRSSGYPAFVQPMGLMAQTMKPSEWMWEIS